MIDEDEPVFIRRIHFEWICQPHGPDKPLVVVLGMFKPRTGGMRLLNEFACHLADYHCVVKKFAYLRAPQEVRDARQARSKNLKDAHATDLSPWEQDEAEWTQLLAEVSKQERARE